MISNFETLSPEEFSTLKKSVAWVALLIAGADGKIDSTEVSWASKIAKIRSYANPDELNEFYREVGVDFDEQLLGLIESTSKDPKERTGQAVDALTALNDILAKLHPRTAYKLYVSLKSFATHVAKASGGFLRMWSVSYEENKYINLPMITPIEYTED